MSLGNRFGEKSQNELVGVHSDLIILATHTLIECGKQGIDFVVFDGIRVLEEQKKLVAAGSSWTLDSMHIEQETGYGHAVDLVPYIVGKIRFDAVNTLVKIGKVMKAVAAHHGIRIVWGANKSLGGDWRTKNDAYHFELDRRYYL